jgi:CubicO group peptidase (beta-lactamase class C family)
MNGIEQVVSIQQKVQIEGACDRRFAAVREAFASNLDTAQDVGASVAVFVDGEPVVDLWGGHFDATYTRRFERDTIAQTYSTTKTVTALCALVLADRGGIDLDAPVARYWPEFLQMGHGLSLETSIFPGVPQPSRTAWWGGNGGSLAFVDLDARMSIGYVPNRWISGSFERARSSNIVQAAYRALAHV